MDNPIQEVPIPHNALLIDDFLFWFCDFDFDKMKILEKNLLTVAKAMEDKLDDEIASLEKLDEDDLEVLRERRLKQMKKMAEKKKRWMSLGHGEYSEIPSEKDFFSAVKASERVVCHFYRENWPCKVCIHILDLTISRLCLCMIFD